MHDSWPVALGVREEDIVSFDVVVHDALIVYVVDGAAGQIYDVEHFAVCCSVLTCVVMCCNVLQCVLQYVAVLIAVTSSVFQCVAVCVAVLCERLQYVDMCCNVLQCVL